MDPISPPAAAVSPRLQLRLLICNPRSYGSRNINVKGRNVMRTREDPYLPAFYTYECKSHTEWLEVTQAISKMVSNQNCFFAYAHLADKDLSGPAARVELAAGGGYNRHLRDAKDYLVHFGPEYLRNAPVVEWQPPVLSKPQEPATNPIEILINLCENGVVVGWPTGDHALYQKLLAAFASAISAADRGNYCLFHDYSTGDQGWLPRAEFTNLYRATSDQVAIFDRPQPSGIHGAEVGPFHGLLIPNSFYHQTDEGEQSGVAGEAACLPESTFSTAEETAVPTPEGSGDTLVSPDTGEDTDTAASAVPDPAGEQRGPVKAGKSAPAPPKRKPGRPAKK